MKTAAHVKWWIVATALWLVAVSSSMVLGQVTPSQGITTAQAPLVRVGHTVEIDTNGTLKVATAHATVGTFGSIIVGSCTGCGGGGGGGSGSISAYSATNGALVTATPRASWSGGTVPTSTDGTLIVHKSVTTTAGHRYLVLAQAQMNMDVAATNTALWIATNSQAGQSVAIFTISQSYAATPTIMWIDTSAGGTIDFQLWGTPDASNGGDFRTNVYQAGGDKTAWAQKSATAIRVIDLDSGGSGGGGGSSDPYTGNGWTPISGTATLAGAEHVTGAVSSGASTVTGAQSVSGNESVGGDATVTGTLQGNTVVSAGGAFETPGGVTMELIPPAGRVVRIETSGTRPTCNATSAGGLWYAEGAGAGNTVLSWCACGTAHIPTCAWQTLSTF